jgi:peptidyl-prolyl cis-trans isomerase D
MISWLQSTFQRHYKWLFLLLLGVVIVSFVLTITPAGSGLTGAGRGRIADRDYFGHNLASGKEMGALLQAAHMSSWINSGNQLSEQGQLEQVALQRTAILALADKLKVPGPNEEQLKDYIRTKRVFRGPDGNFSPDAYAQFIDIIEATPSFSTDMVARSLAQDYRIDMLNESLIGPGYVIPFEAKRQVEKQETVWSVETATTSYGSFLPEVEVSDSALEEFFETFSANYREGEKVVAKALTFRGDRYVDRIDLPGESDLKAYFESNRSLFEPPSPEAGIEENEPEAVEITFHTVREAVIEVWKQDAAQRLAEEAAVGLTVRLYKNNVLQGSPEYAAALASLGAEIVSLPPFAKTEVPEDTGIPVSGLLGLFSLNSDRYFSDVVRIDDGAAVLIFENAIPSRVPQIEEIRDAVTADYREAERMRLFVENGKVLGEALEAALAKGGSFIEATEVNGLVVESFDAFTSGSPPETFNRALFAQGDNLQDGQLSPMVVLDAEGIFVYLKSKVVPEYDESAPAVSEKVSQLAYFSSMFAGQTVLAELVTRELEKSQQPL